MISLIFASSSSRTLVQLQSVHNMLIAMTLALLASSCSDVLAFTLSSSRRSVNVPRLFSSTPGGGGGGGGKNSVERLEFKIYPDGRIEERVFGVKGSDCQKITEKINEALGQVVSSQPTEEMFEQDITVDQTITNSIAESGGGGDSWDGASSW